MKNIRLFQWLQELFCNHKWSEWEFISTGQLWGGEECFCVKCGRRESQSGG